MDSATLSTHLMQAIRSWDAMLHQQLAERGSVVDWQILGFLEFSQSAAVHGRLTNLTPEDFELRREVTRFWGNYLQQIGAVKGLEAGEIISGPDGCSVQINSVSDDELIINLTVMESPDGWVSQGLAIGKKLEFRRSHFRKETGYDSWIATDSAIPWFVLQVSAAGRKTFEHYR